MRRCFAAFFLLAVASASATSYDLFALVNGTAVGAQCVVGSVTVGCFTVGDKKFVFDAASLSGSGIITPPPPLAAGQFSVTALQTGNLYGFEIIGALGATGIGTSTSAVDLGLSYTVQTTSGQALMTDLHAALNGSCSVIVPAGVCLVQATETAVNASAGTVNGIATGGNVLVTNPLVVNLANTPVTDLFLANQSIIRVTKDIVVKGIGLAPGAVVSADLSVIDQYVSQVVPEPGFYGALALGLSGLMLVRRRRRAA
jgi:hypothetical protein